MAQFLKRNKSTADSGHPRLTEHSGWQSEQLLTDADQYFTLLLQDIASATRRIDLNFYIFERDALGQRIIQALISARQRNVQVRVLMDGIGSAEWAGAIAGQLSDAGCQVRIFRPLPFAPHLFRWSIMQGSGIQKLLHFLMNINQRNHYKLGIIDGHIIWSGSFNISAKHLPQTAGGQGWRDYGVRLTDDNIDDIQACFDAFWGNATRRPVLSRWQRFRTNLSLPMRLYHNKLMLMRIRHARQRIWICNAYFAPSGAVVHALLQARQRQVDVRLILPSVSDVALFPAISRSYYRQLLKHDITLYEYPPRVLHAKVMLLDDTCWIGSTNMNHRSFYHDLELDLVLNKPSSINDVAEQLQLDMQQSQQLRADDYARFSFSLLLGRFLRLFRYWL